MMFLTCTLLLKIGWNKECKYVHILEQCVLYFAHSFAFDISVVQIQRICSLITTHITFHEVRNYVNRISITVTHNAFQRKAWKKRALVS